VAGTYLRRGRLRAGELRWATAAEQRRNSRDVIMVAVIDVSRSLGLDPAVVRDRYRKQSWSLERALELPEGETGARMAQLAVCFLVDHGTV